VVLCLLAAPVAKLTYDNDRWLAADDPRQQALDYLDAEFNSHETLLVILNLPTAFFSASGMEPVRALEAALEVLDGVATSRSPLSATTIIDTGERLEIRSFASARELGILPDDAAYAAAFSRSPYAGRLLSADQRVAVIQLGLDSHHKPLRRLQTLERVRAAIAALDGQAGDGQVTAQLAGDAALKEALDRSVRQEMGRLLGIAALVLTLFLQGLLGRIERTLLLVCTALGCVLAALGWVARLGQPMTAVGLVLPVMVAVIALADGLHILARWDALRGLPYPQRWRRTVAASWLPCLAASLTSALGFGAFASSELLPLHWFGWQSLLAIGGTWPLIVVPCWAMLALFPARFDRPPPSAFWLTGFLPRLLQGCMECCIRAVERCPKTILCGVALGCLLLGAGVARLTTESNFLTLFFKPDSDLRRAFATVDKQLGGSGSIDLILQAEDAEHFRTLAGLEAVEKLGHSLKKQSPVAAVDSYLVPLQTVHQTLQPRGPPLPVDAATLSQELLFLELSRSESERDLLSDYVDFSYRNARLHLQTPNLRSAELAALIAESRQRVAESGWESPVLFTGFGVFIQQLGELVLQTQVASFLLGFGLIAALLLLQFGWLAGLAAILANLLPLGATAGLICWLGVPFDFATILIANITLGLAVDDSIHLLHDYRGQRPGPAGARRSLRVVGSPIMAVGVLFCLGLAVLSQAELVVLARFGAFAIFGIGLSVFATVLFLPALLGALHGRRSSAEAVPD